MRVPQPRRTTCLEQGCNGNRDSMSQLLHDQPSKARRLTRKQAFILTLTALRVKCSLVDVRRIWLGVSDSGCWSTGLASGRRLDSSLFRVHSFWDQTEGTRLPRAGPSDPWQIAGAPGQAKARSGSEAAAQVTSAARQVKESHMTKPDTPG